MGKYLGLGVIVILVLIGLGVAGGSWFTVDQQDRAVILTNGKLTGIAEPGFHWKAPFVDSVVEIKVSGQSQSYPKTQAYSRDQQPADMNISVSYSIPPGKVGELYSQFGSIDNFVSRVIDRQVPQAVENVFGQFNAITAVQDRQKLVTNLNLAVKNAMANYPVLIESVQIENLSFSPAYEKSIEERMQAEIAVTKRQQQWEESKVTAQIQVTNAQAAADAQVAQAKANAQATTLQGEAEAKAIKAKSDALNNVNGNFVDYIIATQWKGVLPTTMVPGQTLPFVKIKNN